MMYLTFFLTITLFFYGLTSKRKEKTDRIKKRLNKLYFDDVHQPQISEEKSSKQKPRFSLIRMILKPLSRGVRRNFKRAMAGDKIVKLEMKLLQAGSPYGWTPVDFRILQISCLIIFPVLAVFYELVAGLSFSVNLLTTLFAIVLGAILPHFYLRQKTKGRTAQAIKELPDILDLLTVSLEAGLGFDGALSKVVAKKEGVLPSEFHRCIEEIRLGRSRREALVGIKQRLLTDEVSVLISNIVQAEKLGIGLVQVLRVLSQEVREQRKQRAEEAAMKAPIKMLFPLVLFIFPSLFIVLLGPAVLQFISAFTSNR